MNRRWYVLGMLLFLNGSVCAQAIPLDNGAITIAIWPFDVNTIGHATNAIDIESLSDAFPEFIAAELSASPNIRLIERQSLNAILSEQKLGSSALAEESTRLRLGRLSGARWMLFGNYLRLGIAWQVDARLVDVETSRVITSFSENGQHNDYLMLSHRMASHLVKFFP